MWTLLLGLDTCSSEQQVRAAYADPFGANSRFLLNALEHVNALLGYRAFHSEQWTVHREWNNLCFKQYLVPIMSRKRHIEDLQRSCSGIVACMSGCPKTCAHPHSHT